MLCGFVPRFVSGDVRWKRPRERACWSALMADVVPGPSLASIDPELQLLIFQSFRRGCATACLCQLEKTCKAFSTVAQLPSRAGNEDEGLSLPEIAARLLMARALALPVRPDGLKPFRPYERGPGEGHKHALNLLERGLLTRGVLHDVPESAVERTGWKLAYSEPYCHRRLIFQDISFRCLNTIQRNLTYFTPY